METLVTFPTYLIIYKSITL